MNIHEYQAKALFEKFGVAVPRGAAAKTPEEFINALTELPDGPTMVKSQIHAGGRGKGTFTDGYKGGVKFCKTKAEAREVAARMLGNTLVTAQTGPGWPQGPDHLLHGRERHQEGVLPRDPPRPRALAPRHRRLDRGRRRDREGGPRDPGEDLQGRGRPRLRARRLPGPGARHAARPRRGGGQERRTADPRPLRDVLGDRRRDGRGQPAHHDAHRRGAGARRQGVLRRQRPLPPPGDRRPARPERGGPEGDRGLEARASATSPSTATSPASSTAPASP